MVEVKLHDIGEGMTEGEVVSYFVKIGDTVKNDQPLAEVQTDKMSAELPSPAAGVVKEIVIKPGETVSVGTTLIIIDSAEKKEDGSIPMSRVLAAPYTRKIARENGVELDKIEGTGAGGKITEEDVQQAITKKTLRMDHKEEIAEDIPKQLSSDYIPFKGRRKVIAKNMLHSVQMIPHVTHFEEIDMTDLLRVKRELTERGHSVSVTAFFIKALTIALLDFPVFNARLDEEKEVITLLREYNIGVAAAADEGLIVPVLAQANNKSIKMIHEDMKILLQKAQNNQLSAKELTGGTFTISNVGPLGSTGATPIINHPQTGLLAIHATKEKPAVKNGEIVIRSLMNISLSFDHRVTDGATAVAFSNRFKDLIETPSLLLLELV